MILGVLLAMSCTYSNLPNKTCHVCCTEGSVEVCKSETKMCDNGKINIIIESNDQEKKPEKKTKESPTISR
jgi:hypothetical protein